MATNKVISKLNTQVNMEQTASQAYLGMAIWCEQNALEGSASFYYSQSDEERTHMLKIIKYINSIGGTVNISHIDSPSKKYTSLKMTLEKGLDSEKKVTASINKLTDLALSEKDFESFNFLQWFISEQAEEEQKFQSILDKFELLGNDGHALYSIDKLMGRMSSAEEDVEEKIT